MASCAERPLAALASLYLGLGLGLALVSVAAESYTGIASNPAAAPGAMFPFANPLSSSRRPEIS